MEMVKLQKKSEAETRCPGVPLPQSPERQKKHVPGGGWFYRYQKISIFGAKKIFINYI